MIFRFIRAARNKIRSQPPPVCSQIVGVLASQVLELVALRSSRRTSPVAVCRI
jgi:hypothetical protein